MLGQSGERILFGSGIGTAAGAGLGILTGLFQARRADRSLAHTVTRRRLSFAPTSGRRGIGASVHGVF